MTIWIPTLDRSKPLYLAIADALAEDVECGILTRGSRLPPQRDLAWKLGVTLGTVTRAYREAETRGLLSGEVGRGSFIRSGLQVPPLAGLPSDPGDTVDLSHAIPPPVITPQEFDQALATIMRDPKKLGLLDYAPPEGFAQHRAMAVQWLKRSGMDVQEKDVYITAGAQLGLLVALQALTEPGERVMAETVNYALLGSTFKSAHLQPLCIGSDADGLRPDEFEKAAASKQSRFLYLVPSIQNPTTHTMSRRRRDEIVAIARKHDVTIIEDDIFRLLDERVQPPTFYSLAPERVVHITGLSKTLAPGLRMGFVVTPQGQDRLLRNHLRSMSPRSVGIAGEMARYWIASGKADDILARIRLELSRRRAVFLEVFKDQKVACEPGSPFAWLKLPAPWTGNRFAAALRARRIEITPGSCFDLADRQNAEQHVRICFGSPQSQWRPGPSFEAIRAIMDACDEDNFTPVA
ncbi:PLP-dependent aminotransferase family protein [Aestuariivirga litoralis]|uniref:aminotransferase-like domain-containing protein n=1 Tax=Aestuariivirga litoralis TaxID=2650924 RepID=UPI0018C5D833|nr:PLP-dependent aminotransferase family protein [Aestuariivirga litoralis]MBG1232932.1 PLP-dependent aminotransferase family protein [Aestuariivirga litoralis]